MIRPPMLKPRDTIGVISPSSAVAALCPQRFERGVGNLEALGFSVLCGTHVRARKGHTAGTLAERVSDLESMFRNEEVSAIIATIGGFNSNQLLDELDYDLIRLNPKILMGYSDVTALLLGIHTMTGLVTFLGPAILPQFGEHDGLHEYTEAAFRAVLMTPSPPGMWSPSRCWLTERLRWDDEDTRPRREEPHAGPRVLRRGQTTGRILAGNLGTMLALLGTPYFPDLEGAILCIEEDEVEEPATIDRMVTQLRSMGAFRQIGALVVGRFDDQVGFSSDDPLADLLLTATRGLDLPVAVDYDFGHTDPVFTLPNGVLARIDFGDEAHFELLEAAVIQR